MNTDSPLDLYIKSNLIADVFNLIGIRAFDRKKECSSKIKTRIKAKQNSNKLKYDPKRSEIKNKLDESKYKSLYLETLEESLRMGHFIRIYPFQDCDVYDKLFKIPRKANKMLYNFLFVEVLKNDNVFPGISPSITEDDVINEYLSRILKGYKAIADKIIEKWAQIIEKLGDFLNPSQQLSSIARIQKFLTLNPQICKLKNEKSSLLKTFTHGQLENMISSMNKEIVPYLFDENSKGILTGMSSTETLPLKAKTFKFLKLKKS